MPPVIMVNGEAGDIPAILASKYAHDPFAGYVTGGYPIEASEKDFAEFARKMRIDQSAGFNPAIARIARAKDVETGAGTPADVPAWLEERHTSLSGVEFGQSTLYCNLATVPAVLAALEESHIGLEIPRWWLAWWWNQPGIPARSQVLAELKRLTGIELPLANLWSCQYRNAAEWELSVVYGEPDFDRS